MDRDTMKAGITRKEGLVMVRKEVLVVTVLFLAVIGFFITKTENELNTSTGEPGDVSVVRTTMSNVEVPVWDTREREETQQPPQQNFLRTTTTPIPTTKPSQQQQPRPPPPRTPSPSWKGHFLERNLSDPTYCISARLPRGDGFGSQIAMELTTLAVAFHTKAPPCIPEWSIVEHVDDKMQHKLAKLVTFPRRSDCESCRLFPGERVEGATWNHPLVYAHYFYTPQVLAAFRQFYFPPSSRSKKLPLGHLAGRTNVAIHVRVMNPIDGGFNTDNRLGVVRGAMMEEFHRVRARNEGPPFFIIYSQNTTAQGEHFFDELVKEPLDTVSVLVLDAPVDETFDGLVRSDVFIMAESAFSISAALLHTGKRVYYLDSWTGPLRHWKCLEANCELWNSPLVACEELACELAFGLPPPTIAPTEGTSSGEEEKQTQTNE